MSRFDYRVVCVEASNGPDGVTGISWYRYVIANAVTAVTGYRSGSRTEVNAYARRCAVRLNSKFQQARKPGSLLP